jgi:hypothetical protein
MIVFVFILLFFIGCNGSGNKQVFELKLNGPNPQVVILGNPYKEYGAKEKNVSIKSEVDIDKLGEYKVIYSLVKNHRKYQAVRVVKVISPEVLIKDFNITAKSCKSFDYLELNKSYTLSNNDWGRDNLPYGDYVQCIFVNKNKGGWVWGWPNGKGGVKGYPEAIYGKKFSHQLNMPILPKQVKEIQAVNIFVDYTDINITGKYNIALESWLHKTDNSSMDDIRYEIMVRFDPNGFVPSKKLLIAKEVNINGIFYNVYKKEVKGRYFYNFVMLHKANKVHLDFKKLLDFLKENDSTCSDMDDLYYNDVEMGVEVVNGSGALLLNNFNVNVVVNNRVSLYAGDRFELDFEEGNYSLVNALEGMRILKSGVFTWTPTADEVGDFMVDILKDGKVFKTLEFNVKDKNIDYNGVFVDLSNKKKGDGSAGNPFGRFKEACKALKPGENIYIRGGEYFNPHFGEKNSTDNRYPAIIGCYGEKGKYITIKPWGNELVKVNFDSRYGFLIDKSRYVKLEGFEIKGISDEINYSDAIKHWWQSSDYYNGSGISSLAKDVIIKDNIVYNTPGAGIAAHYGYSVIEGNIVLNTDWWTIAGSCGIGITKSLDEDVKPKDEFKNIIKNNIIANTQQRIFSRVWSKGYAKLTIDEGEAFLIQENYDPLKGDTGYTGRYLIENNLILYNGKTGVVNRSNRVVIKNNSYYMNGYLTHKAGFRENASDDILHINNVIDANRSWGLIYSIGSSTNVVNINNYARGYANYLPEGITLIDFPPFKNPEKFDFSVSNLPDDVGVKRDILFKMKEKLLRYHLKIEPVKYTPNLKQMTKDIIDLRPKGSEVDYSHYNDENPYVIIKNLPASHPVVSLTGKREFILYTPYKFDLNKTE